MAHEDEDEATGPISAGKAAADAMFEAHERAAERAGSYGNQCSSTPPNTKHNNPCLLNAKDDEPVFVLRAQDSLAAPTIAYWIDLAEGVGVDKAKIAKAREHLDQMGAWRDRHGSKYPD